MAEFDIIGAGFFAFHKRERGGVLFGASAAFVVVLAAIGALFVAVNWSAITALAAWQREAFGALATAQGSAPPAVPDPPLRAFMSLLASLPICLLAGALAHAAWEAACLRWMIRGERAGLLGLSLGADTWRVVATYLVWLCLGCSVYAGIAFVFVGLVGAGVALGEHAGWLAPFAVLAIFAFIGALIFCAVRLAPAAAVSVARRRFSFFTAWAATRGRFWPLFVAFLILYGAYWAASYVGLFTVEVALFGALAGEFMTLASDPDADPARVAQAMADAIFSPRSMALWACVWAAMMVLGLLLRLCLFGLNARAVLTAVEEGKIDAPAAGAAGGPAQK